MSQSGSGKILMIENRSKHCYRIKNYKIEPHTLCVVKLHYSANHKTTHVLRGHKDLKFKLDTNGQIREHSSDLSIIDTKQYINIDKSVGTGTGFYWSETNVSPVYVESRTRMCISN